MQSTNGFTLMELMVVIAIIGILAALAIPAYQDYTVRSRVTEALVFSSVLKQTISENYFARGGYLNGSLDCQGISNISFNSKNISSISCNAIDSSITIQTSLKAGNVALKLSPTVQQQRIIWNCRTTQAVNFKYVPPECRNI